MEDYTYPEEWKARDWEHSKGTLRMFDFKCSQCHQVTEKIVRIWDGGRKCEDVSCPGCSKKMDRQPAMFRINMGPVPNTGYYDENLETFVRTNTHRKEVMEAKGVTEKGGTPKERQAWV